MKQHNNGKVTIEWLVDGDFLIVGTPGCGFHGQINIAGLKNSFNSELDEHDLAVLATAHIGRMMLHKYFWAQDHPAHTRLFQEHSPEYEVANDCAERIDALCNEAAASPITEDVSSLLYVLDIFLWNAERKLGYNNVLIGEADHWCSSCCEGDRLGFWDERVRAVQNHFEILVGGRASQLALAFAFHRGHWFLGRVNLFGPKRIQY